MVVVHLYKQLNDNDMEKIEIDILIERLIKEKQKGGKTVLYQGTVLVVETGNCIVLTTEKQM